MSSESDYESLSRPSGLRSAAALCHREIVRFARQRNRVIGALGQPVLFWLLFGAGLHGAFRIDEDGPTFWEYYFPGTIVLILLFTAIFATISIIEDRREGFLQSVLVAPSPRWSMVLGKVLGGTILAVGQALLFLGVGWAVGLRPPLANVAWLVLMLFITAFGLTSFGFVLAWRMQSTQGFHAIMNLLLMPLWLLSGAFFPIPAVDRSSAVGQHVMHWVMRCNPLTYSVSTTRQLLAPDFAYNTVWTPSTTIGWLATAGFAAAAFTIAWRIAGHRTTGDLL